MYRSFAFSVSFLFLATLPVYAQSSAQKAAVAALVAAERSHYGNSDVEQPSCYIVQSYAQCDFGTGGGNAEATAWLHLKNGTWGFLGQDGGVTYASMMEQRYGIPAPVAKQFQAKLCPSPCPGS
ncbi:MAG: hypothetical protein WAN59_07015 [Candidatus Baltobacteraceae bacterium]|jgi:hypothetical protein